MNCVYILKTKNGKHYIGSTNDLKRRLAEYNSGKTDSLKYLRPLTIAFFQNYLSIKDARLMEQKLKKLKNKNIIERIIKDQKIIMGL